MSALPNIPRRIICTYCQNFVVLRPEGGGPVPHLFRDGTPDPEHRELEHCPNGTVWNIP